MADQDTGDVPASAGFFGKILGGGRKKAKKAILGDDNKLYFDTELNVWRERGKDPPVGIGTSAPPPISSNSASAPAQAMPGAGGRYASAGGFGSSTANPAATPSFLPQPPGNGLPQQPAFLPQPKANGASRPHNFFVPGGQGNSAPKAPAWGSKPAAAKPAWGSKPAAEGPGIVSALSSTSSKSNQGSPPKGDSRTPRTPGSSASNKSPRSREATNWSEWRQQDQESRERERALAEEVGSQVLQALNEDDLEMTHQDPLQMNITSSFNDLEDQPAVQAALEGAGLVEENGSGRLLNHLQHSTDSSLTFNNWGSAEKARSTATSPLRPNFGSTSTSPTTANSQTGNSFSPVWSQQQQAPVKSPTHQPFTPTDEYGLEDASGAPPSPALLDTMGSAKDYFNEGPQEEVEGQPATPADGLDQADAPPEAGLDLPESAPEQQQTWSGGYTSVMIEQWAEHYRTQENWPEEDVQNWLEGVYANPDPAGFVPPEEEPVDDQTNADTPAAEDSSLATNVPPPELAAQSLEETNVSPIADQTVFPTNANGTLLKQHSEQPGMGRIRGLDHLKEMMEAQKREAKSRDFGKLKGPLPYDGVISDQEETPTTSPKAFLAPSSRRLRSRLSKVTPEPSLRSQSAPVDKEILAKVTRLPRSELGAGWLDRFGDQLMTIETKKLERLRQTAKQAGGLDSVKEEKAVNGPVLPAIRTDIQTASPRGPSPRPPSPRPATPTVGSLAQPPSPRPPTPALSPRLNRPAESASPRSGSQSPRGQTPRTPRGPNFPSRLSNCTPAPPVTPPSGPAEEVAAEHPAVVAADQESQSPPANSQSPSGGSPPLGGSPVLVSGNDLPKETSADQVESIQQGDLLGSSESPRRVEDLSSQLAEAATHSAAQQEKIQQLEKEALELRSQAEASVPKEEHQAALSDLTTVRESLGEVQQERDQLVQAAKASEKSQQTLVSDLEKTAEKLDLSKRRQTELEKTAQDFESKAKDALAQAEELRKELSAAKSSKEETSSLQKELEALRQKIAVLEAAGSESETLKVEGEKQAKEIAMLSQELEDSTQKYIDLEDEHEAQLSVINKTKEELSAKSSEAQALQEANDLAQAEIRALQEKVQTGLQLADVASSSDPGAAQKLTALQTEHAALLTKFKKARVAHNNLSKQKKEAVENLDAVRKELQELQSAQPGNSLSDEVEALRSERDKLKARTEELEAQASRIEDRLADSVDQNADLSAKITELQAQVAEMEGALSAANRTAQDQLASQGNELSDALTLADSAASERDEALQEAQTANQRLSVAEQRVQELTEKLRVSELERDQALQKAEEGDGALKLLERLLQEAKSKETRLASEIQEKSRHLASAADEILELKTVIGELDAKAATAVQREEDNDDDDEDLIACLGQQGEKIEMLSALLAEHGVDASVHLDKMDEEYLEQSGRQDADATASETSGEEGAQQEAKDAMSFTSPPVNNLTPTPVPALPSDRQEAEQSGWGEGTSELETVLDTVDSNSPEPFGAAHSWSGESGPEERNEHESMDHAPLEQSSQQIESDWPEDDVDFWNNPPTESFLDAPIESSQDAPIEPFQDAPTDSNPGPQKASTELLRAAPQNPALSSEPLAHPQKIGSSQSLEELEWLDDPIGDGDWGV